MNVVTRTVRMYDVGKAPKQSVQAKNNNPVFVAQWKEIWNCSKTVHCIEKAQDVVILWNWTFSWDVEFDWDITIWWWSLCDYIVDCIENTDILDLSQVSVILWEIWWDISFADETTIDWTNTTNTWEQNFDENYIWIYDNSIINFINGTDVLFDNSYLNIEESVVNIDDSIWNSNNNQYNYNWDIINYEDIIQNFYNSVINYDENSSVNYEWDVYIWWNIYNLTNEENNWWTIVEEWTWVSFSDLSEMLVCDWWSAEATWVDWTDQDKVQLIIAWTRAWSIYTNGSDLWEPWVYWWAWNMWWLPLTPAIVNSPLFWVSFKFWNSVYANITDFGFSVPPTDNIIGVRVTVNYSFIAWTLLVDCVTATVYHTDWSTIQWGIDIYEAGVLKVTAAKSLDFNSNATVTDMWWGVARVDITGWGWSWYAVEGKREVTAEWIDEHILTNSPAWDESFIVYTDSGTGLFPLAPASDYTYNPFTQTINFTTPLGASERAYIFVFVATWSPIASGQAFIEEYEATAAQTDFPLVQTPAWAAWIWVSTESSLYGKQGATRDFTYDSGTNSIIFNTPRDAWDVITVQFITGVAPLTAIKPSDLDAINSPVDDYVAKKVAWSDKFERVAGTGEWGITAYTIEDGTMDWTTPVVISDSRIELDTPFNIYYESEPVGNITRTLWVGTITLVSDDPADTMNFRLVIFGFGNKTTYIQSEVITLNGAWPRVITDSRITADTPVNLFTLQEPNGFLTIEADTGELTITTSWTEVDLEVRWIAFTELSVWSILNDAYGVAWATDETNGASRQAIYDKIESMLNTWWYLILAWTNYTFASAPTTRSNTNSTPTKVKEILINSNWQYRFSAYLEWYNPVSNPCIWHAQIYKNWVAYWIEHTIWNANITFSEDLTFSKTDLCQLYIWVTWSANSTVFTQNVLLKWDHSQIAAELLDWTVNQD